MRKIAGSDDDGQKFTMKKDPLSGKKIRWHPSAFPLKFAVLKADWPKADQHATVKAAAQKAAQDWTDLSDGVITFQYVEEAEGKTAHSAGNPPEGLTFAVRPYFGGDFVAAAFFPDDPGFKRWVDVNVVGDESFFAVPSAGFDQVGILRHEWGHIIGARHEHIRSEAPISCQGESTEDADPITVYDPKSVMHYFCGGAGTKKLQFTAKDKEGVREVYPRTQGAFFLAN